MTGEAIVNVPRPMLASALEGRLADYLSRSWALEEKYDGIRVEVRVQDGQVDAWSRPRTSKPANRRGLPAHLVAALRQLPSGVYDGELVAPAGKSWAVGRLDTRRELSIVLFDLLEVLGESTVSRTYTERRDLLALALAHAPSPHLRMPDSVAVSVEAVAAIWSRGGEGAILKRRASTYQIGKRSKDWVKVKRTFAATVTITGFKAGKTGPYAIACVRSDDGHETTVGTRDRATAAAIAADPQAWVGRRLVISYAERTREGAFRHGGWDHLAERD